MSFSFGDGVGGREPVGGGRRLRELDVDLRVGEPALGTRRVDGGVDAADVAGQVVEVADGRLERDQAMAALVARVATPATAPAPPVSTTETGRSVGTSGSWVSLTTSGPTRSAYHSPLRAAYAATASGSVGVTGREDGGIVDEAAPGGGEAAHEASQPRRAGRLYTSRARPRLPSWSAMIARCTSLAPSQIRSTRSSRKKRSATFSRM